VDDAQLYILIVSLSGAVLLFVWDTITDTFPFINKMFMFTYVMFYRTESIASFRARSAEYMRVFWEYWEVCRTRADDAEEYMADMKMMYRTNFLFEKSVAKRVEILMDLPESMIDDVDRERLRTAVNRLYDAWQVTNLEEANARSEWRLEDGVAPNMRMALLPYMAFVMRERERVTLVSFLHKAIARTQASRDISKFRDRLRAMNFEENWNKGHYKTLEMVLRQTEMERRLGRMKDLGADVDDDIMALLRARLQTNMDHVDEDMPEGYGREQAAQPGASRGGLFGFLGGAGRAIAGAVGGGKTGGNALSPIAPEIAALPRETRRAVFRAAERFLHLLDESRVRRGLDPKKGRVAAAFGAAAKAGKKGPGGLAGVVAALKRNNGKAGKTAKKAPSGPSTGRPASDPSRTSDTGSAAPSGASGSIRKFG